MVGMVPIVVVVVIEGIVPVVVVIEGIVPVVIMVMVGIVPVVVMVGIVPVSSGPGHGASGGRICAFFKVFFRV